MKKLYENPVLTVLDLTAREKIATDPLAVISDLTDEDGGSYGGNEW